MKRNIIIVGGGIAGAAAGYFLSSSCKVTLLERENFPGYHSTGRSAAVYQENYGADIVSALVKASHNFLHTPPHGFTEESLFSPLGLLTIGAPGQGELFEAAWKRTHSRITDSECHTAEFGIAKVPSLLRSAIQQCIWEPQIYDIDVASLFQGFINGIRARGGTIVTDAEVEGMETAANGWIVAVRGSRRLQAEVVVNAAGGWATQVAHMAGASNIEIQSRRRTALLVDLPRGVDARGWPMVSRVDGTLYFRPSSGGLLVSPADAHLVVPNDAQPEELDIAVTIERLHDVLDFRIARVRKRWAGLRSFARDEIPVVGWDPKAPNFFWLAGQGGAGIKTSPALGALAASIIAGMPRPAALVSIDSAQLAPNRRDLWSEG